MIMIIYLVGDVNKMGKRKKGRLKRKCERAMYVLDVPPEAVLGTLGVRMVSDCYARIENHGGILELKENLVRLRLPEGEFRLTGENLTVELMEGCSMNIRGRIDGMQFGK